MVQRSWASGRLTGGDMDPLTLSILAAQTAASVGSTIAAGKRAQSQQIQEAIGSEGKSTGEAYAGEAEQKRNALANLIAAYRSSIGN